MPLLYYIYEIFFTEIIATSVGHLIKAALIKMGWIVKMIADKIYV
jgi:hypothetical protein